MTNNDGCITFVLIAVAFCAIGFAAGHMHCDARGIDLGTVTAAQGVLTITGEARVVPGENGPMLVVTERQGDAVVSTSYLREWVRVERAVSR